MLMNRIYPPPPPPPCFISLFMVQYIYVRNYLGYVDNLLSSLCGQEFFLGSGHLD